MMISEVFVHSYVVYTCTDIDLSLLSLLIVGGPFVGMLNLFRYSDEVLIVTTFLIMIG